MLTRRDWIGAAALAPALLNGAAKRPNIVIFLADDLGSGDLSSYGCPDIRTPNIDAIGARGVRFTRFYSNAPECTPSRCALLTGRYPQRVGGLECAIGVGDAGRYDEAVWLQQRGELGLPAAETTIAQMLKRAGYETAMFGKWHLGYPQKFWPDRHGFDVTFGILGGNADYFTHREEDGRQVTFRNGAPAKAKGYLTDVIAGEAIQYLRRPRISSREPAPFFLYVAFTAPHTPIQDPDEFDEVTGTAPWRQGNRRVYAKMVERMDARVGAVMTQLETMGALDNCIVLFLSDNGADANGSNGRLRGRKSSAWEGGIRVPCLMRWSGVIPEGTTTSQVALNMDLTATLLAAAGAAPPRNRTLDGVDLTSVLTGKRAAFPRTVFWRYKRAENRRKAVREGDWKLVIDNGQEELHNLAADELETNNLLAKEPPVAARLRRKLADWETDVEAPRLRDFYKPRPAGEG